MSSRSVAQPLGRCYNIIAHWHVGRHRGATGALKDPFEYSKNSLDFTIRGAGWKDLSSLGHVNVYIYTYIVELVRYIDIFKEGYSPIDSMTISFHIFLRSGDSISFCRMNFLLTIQESLPCSACLWGTRYRFSGTSLMLGTLETFFGHFFLWSGIFWRWFLDEIYESLKQPQQSFEKR